MTTRPGFGFARTYGARALLLVGFSLMLAFCDLFGSSPSKVRSGQLYEPGTPEYDAYFKDVHLLQVSAAGWDDDKKSTRRPLVDALKIEGAAADVSISQATHEKMVAIAHVVGTTHLEVKNDEPRVVASNESRVDGPTRDLFHAIEQVAKAELDRSKQMRLIPPKVDVLTKSGRELVPRVPTDFARRGGEVATAVKQELDASLEVLSTISTSSRSSAREAEDFVADLQRAVQADPTERLTDPDAGPVVVSTKPSRPPPRQNTGGTAPPTVAKPPQKPPTTGGGEEDFTP